MNNITITNESLHDVTIVSNVFIDYYMSNANGEYVKTYLYLLRAVSTNEFFSVISIADKLNYTERDVCRALKFWEQQGILSLSYDHGDNLTGIKLLPIKKPEIAATSSQREAVSFVAPEKAQVQNTPKKRDFSLDEMQRFREQTDIQEIICVAEQYLGKTLSNTDINTLLYIYDGLKFSAELIEYLIEYCVTREHKSMHYIEATAIGWAEQGIKTPKQAKENSNTYNKTCFSVLKAFGIHNRHPAPVEQKMIATWTDSYGFSIDIILEACNRTMEKINSPSFNYADSILVRWKEKGVKNLSDIKTLDEDFQKEKTRQKEHANENKKNNGKTATTKNYHNRFINFEQRSYDYDALERELLEH